MTDTQTLVSGARFAGIVLNSVSAFASLIVVASCIRSALQFRAHHRRIIEDSSKLPLPPVAGQDSCFSESFLATTPYQQHLFPQQQQQQQKAVVSRTSMGSRGTQSMGCNSYRREGFVVYPHMAYMDTHTGGLGTHLRPSATGLTSELAVSEYDWSLESIYKKPRSFRRIHLPCPLEYYNRVANMSRERMAGTVQPGRRPPRARMPSSKIAMLSGIDLLMHLFWIINTLASTDNSARCSATLFFLQWTQLLYVFYLAMFALTSLLCLRNLSATGNGGTTQRQQRSSIIVAGSAMAAALMLSLLPAVMMVARFDPHLHTCWFAANDAHALRWVWVSLDAWIVIAIIILVGISISIGAVLSRERRNLLHSISTNNITLPEKTHVSSVSHNNSPLHSPLRFQSLSATTTTALRSSLISRSTPPTSATPARGGTPVARSVVGTRATPNNRDSMRTRPPTDILTQDLLRYPPSHPVLLAHEALHGRRPTPLQSSSSIRVHSRRASSPPPSARGTKRESYPSIRPTNDANSTRPPHRIQQLRNTSHAKHMSMPVASTPPTAPSIHRSTPHHIRQHSMPPADPCRHPRRPPMSATATTPKVPDTDSFRGPTSRDRTSAPLGHYGQTSSPLFQDTPRGKPKRNRGARQVRRIEQRVHVLIATGALRVATRAMVPLITQLPMVLWSTMYSNGSSSHDGYYTVAILMLSIQGLLDMMLYYIFDIQGSPTVTGPTLPPPPPPPQTNRGYAAMIKQPPVPLSHIHSYQPPHDPPYMPAAHLYPRAPPLSQDRFHCTPYRYNAPSRRAVSLVSATSERDILNIRMRTAHPDCSSNAVQSETLHGSREFLAPHWPHFAGGSSRNSVATAPLSSVQAPQPQTPTNASFPHYHLPVLSGWDETDESSVSIPPCPHH